MCGFARVGQPFRIEILYDYVFPFRKFLYRLEIHALNLGNLDSIPAPLHSLLQLDAIPKHSYLLPTITGCEFPPKHR